MTWATFTLALFNALSSIPKIYDILKEISVGVFTWYVSQINEATAKKIADAAAYGAKAKTKEERYDALIKWQRALSSKRFDDKL